MVAGVWISRLFRTNLMDDIFNNENESLQQETNRWETNIQSIFPLNFIVKTNRMAVGLILSIHFGQGMPGPENRM